LYRRIPLEFYDGMLTRLFLKRMSEEAEQLRAKSTADDVLEHTTSALMQSEMSPDEVSWAIEEIFFTRDAVESYISSSIEGNSDGNRLREKQAHYRHSTDLLSTTIFNNKSIELQAFSHKGKPLSSQSDPRRTEYRLSTFLDKWPEKAMKPIDLARAGFYYYRHLEVVCAFCHKVLRGNVLLDQSKNPLFEHLRMNILCPFILGFDVNNDPLLLKDRNAKTADVNPNDAKPLGRVVAYQKIVSNCFQYPQQADYEHRRLKLAEFYFAAEKVDIRPDRIGYIMDQLLQEGFFFVAECNCVQCFSCGGRIPMSHRLDYNPNDSDYVPLIYSYYYHNSLTTCDSCQYFNQYKRGDILLREADVSSLPIERPRKNPSRLIASLLNTEIVKMVSKDIAGNHWHSLFIALRLNIFGCADILDERLTDKEAKARLLNATNYVAHEEDINRAINKLDGSLRILEGESGTNEQEIPSSEKRPSISENEFIASVEPDDQLCRVCFTNDINVVLNPCFHFVVCRDCRKRLTTCPICRETIVNSITLRESSLKNERDS
jgi:hypothetical protein